MRISDWSSDVCSSDLDNNAAFYSHQVVMTFNPSLSIPAGKQGDQKVYHDMVTMEPPAGVDGKATPSMVAVKSAIVPRSEERRVGNECVSTCRSRWSPYYSKKNHYTLSTFDKT